MHNIIVRFAWSHSNREQKMRGLCWFNVLVERKVQTLRVSDKLAKIIQTELLRYSRSYAMNRKLIIIYQTGLYLRN